MALLDLVTLPARLTVAAVRTTLALGELVDPKGPIRRENGYADRAMLLIGEGGLLERLATVLADPRGPMHLVNTVTAVLDVNRPLGRALAPGGTVDRLLAPDGPVYRMLEPGGTLDQLAQADGPLDRLLEAGGALDSVTRKGGVLDRLLEEDGLVDRLLSEDGFVDKLVAEGGTLDQLVALGAILERIQPGLAEMIALIPELHESVDTLNRSVGPLGELANRIPGSKRRPALEA
jgi:hypothetical protein